ncbi:riboflavin kinase/FMN adenylyltransferase [Scopulibacillus darangshiensis]|uniref:Riboflavin biosynthesis protein n=1 Tax=Scopulibacillus darangshiensis TaxID=442528 RepID=A0A4R2P7J2_9BACL|nr:adenylyltransferase/cytidyltransferase family protein [Scopulibacillus darangshiensis]TCP30862.1 riboflavin kinase/FMN adenylyltransferase [Scopulibacillus darangshiensis]
METIHVQHPLNIERVNKEPCVMALGFFDGLHIGHQEIIRTAKKRAEERNLALALMTFSPHPSQIIPMKKKVDHYLSPLEAKRGILAKLGVQKLYVVTFDHAFAKLTPAEFVDHYLIDLQCRHAVAGFDFSFGFKGQGNMGNLAEFGKGAFGVTTVPKVERQGQKVSSTLIRSLLASGNVNGIPEFLGDFYKVTGQIAKHGDSECHEVRIEDYLLPHKGIYEISAEMADAVYNGVCMIEDDPIKVYVKLFNSVKARHKETIQIKWIKKTSSHRMLQPV